MTITKPATRLAAALLAALLHAAPGLGQEPLAYRVELADSNHFAVRLAVDGLPADAGLYQFAATAPGTYQVMDIGRYVSDFRAEDADAARIPVERVSTNQWRILEPERVRTIAYRIAETWDTPVSEHPIYPMAGTSIEADHVMINGQAVIGYPTGLQAAPIRVHLGLPDGWTVGTAMERAEDGGFEAESFDHLVDSPILAGTLTTATTEVTGTDIEIHTYSPSGNITSQQILGAMARMLEGAGAFLGGLPVDRYVFLYHFGWTGQGAGAWEHSYSSLYTFPDLPWVDQVAGILTDVAAHEFLHIVTPLNIHSEIIEEFDFVEPVPSRHLWLYEGVTEWGAHKMQLEAGLKPLEDYLQVLVEKIRADRGFDPELSLEELSLTSYTADGQAQYVNIYQRGALVAGLLDILLLDLSDGERDLEDLVGELMDRYGDDDPFEDCCLYDVIGEMAGPEVRDFLARYVERSEPLPIAEMYGRLGIELAVDESGAPTGLVVNPDPGERALLLRTVWLEGEPPE